MQCVSKSLLEYHISETACEDPHRRAKAHMPKPWMWQGIILQKITGDPPADLPEGETHFCKHKDCKKLFATKAGLKAHSLTHKTLPKNKSVCSGCGKGGFTREKSLKDHFRYCDGNPEKVGPFPCLVPGCPRGPAKPFRRTHNLNVHMKEAHDFDPKHAG